MSSIDETAPGDRTQEDGTPAAPVLVVALADRDYALPIEAIVEVVAHRAPTQVPGARPWIAGIRALRGRMVTVVDARLRLGLAPRPADAAASLVVLRDDGEWFGLVVDAVRRVAPERAGASGQEGPVRLEPAHLLRET